MRQSRVSFPSLHWLLLLVSLVDTPVPQDLEQGDQAVVWDSHCTPATNTCSTGWLLKAARDTRFKTNGVKIMARVIWLLCLLCPESVYSPDRDLDVPLHSGLNLFLSARWFSNTLLSFLCFFICFFTTRVSSGHSSWSQHPPGTLTRFGFAQPSLGRMTTWGQRETQPTAPSMQVHWCLQFGRKFSPFW